MDPFQEILAEIARLTDALETKGDPATEAIARQNAQASALKLKLAVERARSELSHAREISERKAASSLDSALRSESLRADMAEAERKALQARVDSLVAHEKSRVSALEEEIDALLSPLRGATARTLYEKRIRELEIELSVARAEREAREGKLAGNGEPRSEIELGRDGVMVQIALARETEVAERLGEARSRLERLGLSG
jgi:hypothetical protein